MIIVVDTNVLVAGLLSPFGPCGDIVRMLSSGELTLMLDARLLTEYKNVLHRPKFGFQTELVAHFLSEIEAHGQLVAATPLPTPLPDPDDEPFLEIAIASQASYLVTGNLKHFPASARNGVAVVSPRTFITEYRKLGERY